MSGPSIQSVHFGAGAVVAAIFGNMQTAIGGKPLTYVWGQREPKEITIVWKKQEIELSIKFTKVGTIEPVILEPDKRRKARNVGIYLKAQKKLAQLQELMDVLFLKVETGD